MKRTKAESRMRRKFRIRKRVSGDSACPRISVFRSNRYLSAQAVDDEDNKIIASIYEKSMKVQKDEKPVDRAFRMGEAFGGLLSKKKVKTVVFDRSGYKYHGRVKSFADGIRKSGFNF